jgi:phosphate transport system substrate-binding protein
MKKIILVGGFLVIGVVLVSVLFLPTPHIYHSDQIVTVPHQFESVYLRAVGSATLNNLMVLWSEKMKPAPNEPFVQVLMEAKGSSAAATGLLSGLADLGPMSRPMDELELETFRHRLGYIPRAITVAWDAVEVFVNLANPIEALSLGQLESVFSWALNQEFPKQIKRWGELDIKNESLSVQNIRLNGPNSASGTYMFFKTKVLRGADFKNSLREYGSGSAVVQAVADDQASIGFTSSGFSTPTVKSLSIISDWCLKAINQVHPGFIFRRTALQICRSKGAFIKLRRPLYIYVLAPPQLGIPESVKAFLEFVLSPRGQTLVFKDGYKPLSPEEATEQLQAVYSTG